jgi:hypothetical protein
LGGDTDDEIDVKEDAACHLHLAFPGSRNIRGLEIADGAYQNIVDLPPYPVPPFAPSCPGCGLGCDSGGKRLCAASSLLEWNELTSEVALGTEASESSWINDHSGSLLTAMCVKPTCV